jgi:hypothetical protein
MALNKSNVLIATQAALSGTASQVLQPRNERYFLAISNLDAAIQMYIGPTSGVTAANGFRIAPNTTFIMESYVGPLFAIAASGTPTMAFLEW